MGYPTLLIFADGKKIDGGSGFCNLVAHARLPTSNPHKLRADIVGVVSRHESGGVQQHAKRLRVRFRHFAGPYTAKGYQALVEEMGAEWIALSGYLKPVIGLDPRRVINIHPGPLPRFGGKGMHGVHVHAAVLEAYRAAQKAEKKNGALAHSEVCMHFVTDFKTATDYDTGPVFLRMPVPLYDDDTPLTLQARVQPFEHQWQPFMINRVIHGGITWDGADPQSLAGDTVLVNGIK